MTFCGDDAIPIENYDETFMLIQALTDSRDNPDCFNERCGRVFLMRL